MSKRRKPRKNGRPSLYRKEYAAQAFGYALAGMTDKEIAEAFGIGESTLNDWKRRYPKFLESIRTGKMPANGTAAATLYKVANGYETTVEEVVKTGETFEVVKIKQFVPPDVNALKFFLKNRMPDKFRDKHEQVLTDPNGAGAFDVLAVEIAKQLAKDSEKAA